MAAGFCTSIAVTVRIRDTTGQMSASVAPTAASTEDRREEMKTRTLVEDLMGRKPEKRYAFIQENAKFARDLLGVD